jgi:nucleoid DNA-binding protein
MELSQGRIVKLGHVGTFQVSVSAAGQVLQEDVTATDIKKSRILFRPAKKLRQMLSNLSYQKAS